ACTSSSFYTPAFPGAKDYFGLCGHQKDMRFGRSAKSFAMSHARKSCASVAELKARDFGEVKAANLHRRDHHIEGLFAAGADGGAHGLNVVQRVDQALVEAEIADAVFDSPVFHQERAVARHAGENFLVRINLADVPQPRDEDAVIGGGHHLLHGLLISRC